MNLRSSSFPLAVLSIALVLGACSSGGVSPGADAGAGGSPGGGGAKGTGGKIGTGGVDGSGGARGTGGVHGVGGFDGGGGAPGTGGLRGTGGLAADGGADRMPMAGSPCASDSDCGPNIGLLICRAPGEFLGCGACQTGQDQCTNDDDCAQDAGSISSPRICQNAPSSSCYCRPTRVCQTGCRTNDVCGSGQGCEPTSHTCRPTCGDGGVTCPADFSCDANGFCARISCTSDAPCSGACVKGKCYSTPGGCATLPV